MRGFVTVAAIVLCGCATPMGPTSKFELVTPAIELYWDCNYLAARKLALSSTESPQSIAVAARTECGPEMKALTESLRRVYNVGLALSLIREAERMALDKNISTVVFTRSLQKKD